MFLTRPVGEFGSRAELSDALEGATNAIVLDRRGGFLRASMFVVEVVDQQYRIGVVSGIDTAPLVAMNAIGYCGLVGFDTALVSIDVRIGVLHDTEMSSVFFEFLDIGQDDEILAVYETLVGRFSCPGGRRWLVQTEIIDSVKVEGEVVRVSEMGQPSELRLSLQSGAQVRGKSGKSGP